MKNSITASGRVAYLDGVRGIASLLVVFCHLSCAFLPQLYYEGKADSWLAGLWINTPLNILTNGRFAVTCFFVLSGFLIARKMYAPTAKRVTSPFKTYGKLLQVVIPAVLLAALLMAVGAFFHLRAATLSPNLEFLLSYNNFSPSLFGVLKDMFLKTFVSGSDYVGPLWTIRYEFLGSLMIAAVAAYTALGKPKHSKLIYLALSVFFFSVFSSNLVPFFFGALAYESLHCLETDDSIVGKILLKISKNKWLLGLLFCVGAYFATVNYTLTGVYTPLSVLPFLKTGAANAAMRACGVSVCVFCIGCSPLCQRLLSARPLTWLGSVSAYLYAFHWPVILSVGCGLFVLLYDYLPYSVLLVLVCVASLAVSILLAYGYMRGFAYMKKKVAVVAQKLRVSRKSEETV